MLAIRARHRAWVERVSAPSPAGGPEMECTRCLAQPVAATDPDTGKVRRRNCWLSREEAEGAMHELIRTIIRR